MDELPELVFLKVLDYLSLQDRLRLRAISRSCHEKITNSRVKSLCFSDQPMGLIREKSRWVSGAFAANFISSTRFASFFNAFGQTILSTLKHLRLCDLDLRVRAFSFALNSLSQLEQLDIVRVQCRLQLGFELNLPMLTSIHLEELTMRRKLVLKAPRLRNIRILYCYRLSMDIVHGESVQRLITDCLERVEVIKLKNLLYLYIDFLIRTDSTLLADLEQLKEIHTNYSHTFWKLFEQKQQYGRADVKIYLNGLLLNGPDDPAINAAQNDLPSTLSSESFAQLSDNRSRLADVIPFYRSLNYSAIALVAPELEVDLLRRFTELNNIKAYDSVQDFQRFLNLLKNFSDQISSLEFAGFQPQDLFDRLPEHCAVQRLTIDRAPSHLAFLFRLKNITHLHLGWWTITDEFVRKAFEELPSLYWLGSRCHNEYATIELARPNRFKVSIPGRATRIVLGLNAVIEFILGKEAPKKRKAKELE